MLTILHGSDLQMGAPYRPEAGEAFIRFAHELQTDAIILSSDLTQRAKVSEYRNIQTFLTKLPNKPTIITPNNHNIPLYQTFKQTKNPYQN